MDNNYTVYNINELLDEFSTITEKSQDVDIFFQNFSFNTIINQNIAKDNSAFIFKNAIKEDTIKSKIIQLLNKLNQQNINKIIIMIREIIFQTTEDIIELVNQCIQKIKKDNNIIRPLVANLCYELLSTYFITSNGEKIFFRKIFLTNIKEEYISSINYDSDKWSKEKAEHVMILLGASYNSKIIDNSIMDSIINDFKNKIIYKEDITSDIVEKSIYLLSFLISSIIVDENVHLLYKDLDIFLENQMAIYNLNNLISKKSRLICKNTIYEMRKK